MKKVIKKKGLFSNKIKYIVDERLNNINLETLAPKKLEEANFHLKKMKSIPK
jgi:hypothetical protein